jgi:hypothetical protein
MISFQKSYERLQSMTGDSDTASTTLFKALLNEGSRKCYEKLDAEYFYTSITDTTVDGNESYPLPYDCEKIHNIKVTINSIDYIAVEYPYDENSWNALVGGSTTSSEQEYPTYYFVKRNTIEIWPFSSTSAYTITIRYKRRVKDLSQDDYVTGNITTLANGGTAVTGSGTTWTAAFVGRYFKIDAEGIWYEITGRSGNTAITLAREYGGTAIVAGSESYTIGEFSLLPETFQTLPLDFALAQYYLQKENQNLYAIYNAKFERGLQELKETGGNLTTSGVIEENVEVVNYNDYPQNLS